MLGCKINDPLQTLFNCLKKNVANMPLIFHAQQLPFKKVGKGTIMGKKGTNVKQWHLKGIKLGTNLKGKKINLHITLQNH